MKVKLIKRFTMSGILIAGLLAISAVGVFAQNKRQDTNKPNAELAKEAKYTIEQARKIALRQSPGKIKSEKLYKENGNLIYLFEIRDYYEIFVDVKVDAITGKILGSELEDNSENIIPNMASNMKNGTIKSVKKVGNGIQSVAGKIIGFFFN